MTKILYIHRVVQLQTTGVLRKVISKIELLNSLGLETKGVFIFDNNATPMTYPFVENVVLEKPTSKLDFEKKYYQAFEKAISQHLDYDFVLTRYEYASYYLLDVVTKYPQKVCFEHNAKEAEENKSLLALYSWRDLLYVIKNLRFDGYTREIFKNLTNFDRYYRIESEKHFAAKILQKARLGIGVTDEIAAYEIQRAGNAYKTFTVSNSVNVAKIPLRNPADFDGSQLNMVFLCGWAAPWHGVEKILHGIANYKGNTNILLYLVGDFSPVFHNLVTDLKLSNQVIFTGILSGNALNDLMDKVHIGIGALANHRRFLKEASILKNREYMAYGLALVDSGEDTDFKKHSEFNDFVLRLPADEQPTDIAQIIEFTKKVYQISEPHKKMRALAEKYLDTKVKMQQLKDIFVNEEKKSK
jgi:hypothetical protein